MLYEQSIFTINKNIEPNKKRAIKGNTLNTVLKAVFDTNNLLAYSTKRPYKVGCICVYDNSIYVCNTDTSGVFVPADWDEIIYI